MIRLVSLELYISTVLSAHADLGTITCEFHGHLHIVFYLGRSHVWVKR